VNRILLTFILSGCVAPRLVADQVQRADETIEKARALHAVQCAPTDLANAEAEAAFTRIELEEGNLPRARKHAEQAMVFSKVALEVAEPCGSQDRDGDGIADVVDVCPDEPEDFDGDRDTDGCRDILPYGDEDGDGIMNIDDACIDTPEDLDGHNDEDGCPETSEDSDGDGIIDAWDACPQEAEDLDGFRDTDGCPDLDNDEDGIVDLRDSCMNIAEDLDGWEDDDGCPDPDNDLDGVADVDDQCPNQPGDIEHHGCPAEDADRDGIADAFDECPDEPETPNMYLDDDGCPDVKPQRVNVTNTRVEITEVVAFDFGTAKLRGSQSAVLDDVVQVLKDDPSMTLRVEGHTDNKGSHEHNMSLSQSRAETVREYMIRRGIDPSRLTAHGYGETRPIDTNRTDSGRARNRRVEFVITE